MERPVEALSRGENDQLCEWVILSPPLCFTWSDWCCACLLPMPSDEIHSPCCLTCLWYWTWHTAPEKKEKKGKLVCWQWQRSQQPSFGTRRYKLERKGLLRMVLFTNLNWRLLSVPVTLYNTHSCPRRRTLSFFLHNSIKVVLHRMTDTCWHRSFTYSFTTWSSQMLIHHLFVMILRM